jgi:hypothetical protein
MPIVVAFATAFDDLDALEAADEIDPPILTTELTVRDDWQAEILLVG